MALIAPRPLPLPLLSQLLPAALPLPSSECSSGAEALLAEALPVLVPSLVVSTRPALVPLILHTVAHHPDQETRDSLLQILFNLVKRPEEGVREKIVSGLHWLLCQPGWTSSRVEEEVTIIILILKNPTSNIQRTAQNCSFVPPPKAKAPQRSYLSKLLQVLPQCWEQVSHKHPERRQLIAQVMYTLSLLLTL